jgi:TRAP-type C4-dicarboxylate transport system permease small subunit
VDRLAWGLQVIAEIAVVVLLLLVSHEVFRRYALNSPTQFSVEFSEYLLVLISFASAAWVLRRDRHVRVRLVTDALPPRPRAALEAVGMVLLASFCAVLVWKGGDMAWTALHGNDRSSSLVAFPLWIPYSFIPVGGFVLGLQALVRAGEALAVARGHRPVADAPSRD